MPSPSAPSHGLSSDVLTRLKSRPSGALVLGMREQDVVGAEAAARVVLTTREEIALVVDRDRRIAGERAARLRLSHRPGTGGPGRSAVFRDRVVAGAVAHPADEDEAARLVRGHDHLGVLPGGAVDLDVGSELDRGHVQWTVHAVSPQPSGTASGVRNASVHHHAIRRRAPPLPPLGTDEPLCLPGHLRRPDRLRRPAARLRRREERGRRRLRSPQPDASGSPERPAAHRNPSMPRRKRG